MIILEIQLAAKYAKAFLNLYKEEIDLESMNKILFLEKFLREHKNFYVYLEMSSVPIDEKVKALKKLIQNFKLQNQMINLFLLLYRHNRIDFFDKILLQINNLFRIRSKILEFKIFTSHELSDEEKRDMVSFIKSKIKKYEINAQFHLDPSLLVGIRFQSSHYLWEKSIKKQLQHIYNELIEKGCS